jgi:manganese transport protein
VFSQVVLSMQLPFAVIPLIWFVSDRESMGRFAIPRSVAVVAWLVAGLIVVLNVKLLVDAVLGTS